MKGVMTIMAIIFRCAFPKEMKETFYKYHSMLHEALKGSPAYINNEIVLSSDESTELENISTLIVGNNNDKDVFISLNEFDVYNSADQKEMQMQPDSSEVEKTKEA